jgi:AraC-like DNA-binding protein
MYRELAPPADLAPYVACVWSTIHRGGVIFPDGCVDLVWHGTHLVLAGPATGPMSPDLRVGDPVFGVRFRLGVAGAALGLPAEEFADVNVRVADVWGADVDERVAEGGMPALLEIVRERLDGVELDPLARLAAVAMAAPGARVDALGADLGVSERQLRRRFADAVGYGPKTLARVLRFQRFLALARSGDELARLALSAGYADQAHLTRETRRLAGRTPRELLLAGAGPAGERLAGATSDGSLRLRFSEPSLVADSFKRAAA